MSQSAPLTQRRASILPGASEFAPGQDRHLSLLEVWMRADDPQLMQPIYIATFTKAGGKDVRIDAEGTGFGWTTGIRIEPADTVMATSCVMTRP